MVNLKKELRKMAKEYRVVEDLSFSKQNNVKTVEKRINKLAKEGFKVVSSCAFKGEHTSNIYVIMEREI